MGIDRVCHRNSCTIAVLFALQAQACPSRPITVIVPLAAGGPLQRSPQVRRAIISQVLEFADGLPQPQCHLLEVIQRLQREYRQRQAVEVGHHVVPE